MPKGKSKTKAKKVLKLENKTPSTIDIISKEISETFSEFGRTIYNNLKWNEPMDHKFQRACIAEFLAMLLFVVLACGGAMTTFSEANPSLVEIAFSFGFGIMVIAQLVGPLSGGHINCAVSFALFLGGRITAKRFVYYLLCQMAGAFMGAIFLLATFGTTYLGPNQNFASNSWDPEVFNGGQVFLAEIFGTSILVFNVFATIDHPVAGGGALGIFPIAMSVLVAHLFLIPIDGCSINPTRSFGPYVVASLIGSTGNFTDQQYMFWIGPIFGAAIATLIYEYGSMKPSLRDGGGDLATALHMSEVKRLEVVNAEVVSENKEEIYDDEHI